MAVAACLLPPSRVTRVVLAQSGVTIVGSVVDAGLNPVAGVAVSLERDSRVAARTTTDSTGKFRFVNVAAGSYRVHADLAGFTSLARDIRVAAAAKSIQLPLVLTRPAEKIEDSLRQGEHVDVQSRPNAPVEVQSNVGAGRGLGTGFGLAGAAGGRGGSPVAGAGAPLVAPRQSAARIEPMPYWPRQWPESDETYTTIQPNTFQPAKVRPLSTFGADVDTASYSIVRRFLSNGQLPPPEAVRLEEMVNYFRFAYADPRDGRPIALTTEIGDCPWAPLHKLVLIGARAKAPAKREMTGRNLTLLIDVSGSMAPPERLPLIKTALSMFVDTLSPDDTLSIVTYAGTSGVALEPTPARRRDEIQRAIASLNAGGSTNGAAGLITAYRVAREGFIPGGVNRVILATDGDFNVGITSQNDLLHLIERERDSGVFLSVFGVGSGNLKDRTMELLADKGDGNYSYLDSLQEARRVLIREGEATLETVAKDVKFQVEFNPAVVSEWKLLGYEDRALRTRDFDDDSKDAGDMGAGHTVTVIYEIIPVGAIEDSRAQSGEWLQVRTRYKLPEGDTSQLITQVVRPQARMDHLPLASAVAEFALLLRDTPHNVERWNALAERVRRLDTPAALGPDREGFKELVEIARGLARR
jgi:Ca-activated chloride channel family protein